MKCCHFTE